MESTTLSAFSPAQATEHRRAARMRKVRPVAFIPQTATGAEPSLRTVTANVSRSGMLLVTRRDQFPPAGAGVLLMPYEIAAGAPDENAAIRGRIIYTRFSPRAQLRFAGLKFEQDLSDRSVRALGLDGAPDAVSDAISTLDELETLEARMPAAPAPVVLEFTIEDELTHDATRSPAQPPARADLDAARRELYRAAAAFLSEWGEGRIRQTLAARHAFVRAKGLEGLRALKSDWLKVLQKFPVLAEVELGRAADAGRAGDTETNPYYNARLDQPPARIMQALRDLAGHLGQILIHHGLEDIGPGGEWAPITGERGRVTLRGPMAISETLREMLIRVADLHREMQRAMKTNLDSTESEARAEILRMWTRA